mmetsp:Transcript_29675/g.42367  ORF Transcript_29675/g.42367 Transcript_29675/m.42367 type:complete len:81 (+) Transcript_29675:61-303(+)
MGAVCCGSRQSETESKTNLMTEEELETRRRMQAEAAEKRSKDFKQGGGGEKLKAKSKALEEAEKKNRELGGTNTLKWSVS